MEAKGEQSYQDQGPSSPQGGVGAGASLGAGAPFVGLGADAVIDFYARISGADDHIGLGWQIFGWLFVIMLALCVRPRGGGR